MAVFAARLLRFALVTAACWLSCQSCAFAGLSAWVVWDSSPSTNVASYNVYYGMKSREYTACLPAGPWDSTLEIPDLTPGCTYFFAVTAVDWDGNESDYSIEAYIVVSPPPVLQTAQVYAPEFDYSSNPDPTMLNALRITTTNYIPRLWVLEYSEDLVQWDWWTSGYYTPVDCVVPTKFEFMPKYFFRLRLY
jgi:hypothetical protein